MKQLGITVDYRLIKYQLIYTSYKYTIYEESTRPNYGKAERDVGKRGTQREKKIKLNAVIA